MYDQSLRELIELAVERVELLLAEMAPNMARPVSSWIRHLSGSAAPVDYFLHPSAFPMFLLPWWVERSVKNEVSLELQSDIAYSTVNGYYYVRLIDDIMDGDGKGDTSLLPALNFFHTESQSTYAPYFGPSHPFWHVLKLTWFRSGDAAMEDSALKDLTEAQFKEVAAKKVCAAKIPVAAVCYHYDRPDLMDHWNRLIDGLGCWHQMMNDLFDWRKDSSYHNPTFLLSEGERRRGPRESLSDWMLRDGFHWATHLLDTWMDQLKLLGKRLDSPELMRYLSEREMLQKEREKEVSKGFHAVSRLIDAIKEAKRDDG